MENITVKIKNEEEQKSLVAFLEAMNFEYKFTPADHHHSVDQELNTEQSRLQHYATE